MLTYRHYDPYKDVDFKGQLADADATVTQVHCVNGNSLFVCDDERLFAVGTPNTGANKWADAYEQKKDFYEIQKPDDCTDYRKVVVSPTNRLILTNSGQLFCQGENLRLYADPDIDKDAPAKEFVDCTEVFPVEDGDKIVDVAAANFFTVVVTEQGLAYAVGHCRYRSHYAHIPGLDARQPAYQLDLPGRATKCFGTKPYSMAFVQVEDDAGGKAVYAGHEFLSMYETRQIQFAGRDTSGDRRYGENDVRQPFTKIDFPASIDLVRAENFANGQNMLALDTTGTLWIWGYKFYNRYADEYGESGVENVQIFEDYKNEWTPCRVDWFEKKGMKVLDFACTETFAPLLVQDANGAKSVWFMSHPNYGY